MKAALLCVINYYLIFLTYARLMHKTTETPITKLEGVDDSHSSKGTDHSRCGEHFKFYHRNVRTVKANQETIHKMKNTTGAKTNNNMSTGAKTKSVLVKKPIPKFHDVDSDEDYQGKLRNPLRLSETIEHEDEDFNVDDYDFDVNHDEYSGRGKPLEPRIKIKLNKPQSNHAAPKRSAPVRPLEKEIEVKPKVIVPRKVDKMKEDEYDVEFSDTKAIEYIKTSTPDNSSDENDNSNEYRPPVRTARSPWSLRDYINKIDDKSTAFMSRVLGILPMFPQQPSARRLDEEVTLMKGSFQK